MELVRAKYKKKSYWFRCQCWALVPVAIQLEIAGEYAIFLCPDCIKKANTLVETTNESTTS